MWHIIGVSGVCPWLTNHPGFGVAVLCISSLGQGNSINVVMHLGNRDKTKETKEISGKVKTGNRCAVFKPNPETSENLQGPWLYACIKDSLVRMRLFWVKQLGTCTIRLSLLLPPWSVPWQQLAARSPQQGGCLVQQVLTASCEVHVAAAWGQWAESRSGNYLKSVLPTLPSCPALPEASCLIPCILFSLLENDSHSKQD